MDSFGFTVEAVMPLTCPACGLVNPDSAGRCDCGHALAAVVVQGEQARVAQQERDAVRQTCPACRSTRYRVGRLPDASGSALTGSNRARFRPEENWIQAHPLVALACLACGHVRLFLYESDRALLDQ